MTHSRKPEPPSGFSASPYFAGAGAKRLAWLGAVALVLAALAINGRAIGFQFIASMDDDINVTLNPHMGAITLERLRLVLPRLRLRTPLHTARVDGVLRGVRGQRA